MSQVGIILFDQVNELDFIGPFEVLSMSNWLLDNDIYPGGPPLEPARLSVQLLSPDGGLVRCEKGLQLSGLGRMADCERLDVILVPGGSGVDALCADARALAEVNRLAANAEWVTSVCNGAFVLAAAGLARGRQVTTHWAAIDSLRDGYPDLTVVEDVQYVRDGRILTSAGVSAGIDMALWLLGQMISPRRARLVQRGMQYNPAPPYAALT